MLRFYYDPKYKYTNRTIIDLTGDTNYVDKDYVNIDSTDTINGHIIYRLGKDETFLNVPTYVYDTVKSWRWFVSGITQLNSQKFQLSLLRDIISENPTLWKNEEAYITAGFATDFNKYKAWDLPFTNTKWQQRRLNINGKSSFFIYYTNTRHVNNNTITEDDLHLVYSTIPSITQFDYTVSDLTEVPSSQYIGAGNLINWNSSWSMTLGADYLYNEPYNGSMFTLASYQTTPLLSSPNLLSGALDFTGVDYDLARQNTNGCLTSLKSVVGSWLENDYKPTFGTAIPAAAYSNLEGYVDKVVYNSTNNKAYILRKTTTNQSISGPIPANDTSSMLQSIFAINWPVGNGQTLFPNGISTFGDSWLNLGQDYTICNYTWEELGNITIGDFTLKADVFKLPSSSVRCLNIVSSGVVTDKDLSQLLMLMQANSLNLGDDTGKIIDIQYLPFSVASTSDTNSDILINGNAFSAKFLDMEDYTYTTTMSNMQLYMTDKETESVKIVSPSRASQFLFKPYNNDGRMVFDTKITLKPFSTVIYIRPSTQGLLMYDWDDKDCLVIAEDMSLTQLSSDWANYVYNNRNYQNAFNRTIQGREYERGWERQVEQANLQAEEWNARNISAQKARTFTGNLPIISDIAGAIMSTAPDYAYMQAVETDLAYNEAMHQESMSLAVDQFNYQLDNIKSQPDIPSKLTTIDCKLLDGVYLEYYSTNLTEKTAIFEFYKYNGNRIDCYGTFGQYWGWFVKGKIIKSQYYTQPEINELNIRLNSGIFTGEDINDF